MRIGVHLPQWGPGANRAGLLAVAIAADEAGFDSVWVADHVTFPVASTSQYPYRADGTPFQASDGFLDSLTMLAVVAGVTERVRLGTSVLLAPLRHPLALAKTIATLDVLSNGRVELALGAGWWREEYEALGIDFATRGARLDETIDALRDLWTDGVAARDGATVSFPEAVCEPRPIQPGGPPLWVGGTSEPAMRRAVRLGVGWHGVGGSRSALADARQRLGELAAGLDRPPVPMSSSIGLPLDVDGAVSRLTALRTDGVNQVVVNFPTDSVDELAGHLRRSGPVLAGAAHHSAR